MAEQDHSRAERLRSALRENLKRRKDQARQRAAIREEGKAAPPARPNSGGIDDDHREP